MRAPGATAVPFTIPRVLRGISRHRVCIALLTCAMVYVTMQPWSESGSKRTSGRPLPRRGTLRRAICAKICLTRCVFDFVSINRMTERRRATSGCFPKTAAASSPICPRTKRSRSCGATEWCRSGSTSRSSARLASRRTSSSSRAVASSQMRSVFTTCGRRYRRSASRARLFLTTTSKASASASTAVPNACRSRSFRARRHTRARCGRSSSKAKRSMTT